MTGQQQQRTKTEIGVRAWTQSGIYVADQMIRIWLEISRARGLDNDYLLTQREILSKGLFNWLLLEYLTSAHLEIYVPSRGRAEERWDMYFRYVKDSGDENPGQGAKSVYRTYMDQIRSFVNALSPLVETDPTTGTTRKLDCKYRVVVNLKPGFPPVAGWGLGDAMRSTDHLKLHSLGDVVESRKIYVMMEYLGTI